MSFEHLGGEAAFEEQQRRDVEKSSAARKAKLTLIEVHYSWDLSELAIREQLGEFFPELNQTMLQAGEDTKTP